MKEAAIGLGDSPHVGIALTTYIDGDTSVVSSNDHV